MGTLETLTDRGTSNLHCTWTLLLLFQAGRSRHGVTRCFFPKFVITFSYADTGQKVLRCDAMSHV